MSADWLPVFLQATAATATVIAAVGSCISIAVSLRNGRTGRRIDAKATDTKEVLQQIKLTINGRLDELLTTTRTLAHVEGAAAARAMDAIDSSSTAKAAAAVLRVAKELAEPPKADQPKGDQP